MIVSEKSHQNLSDYIHFLFKKIYINVIKKEIISVEKMRNSGNFNYYYAPRFSERIFNPSCYTGIHI